VPNADERASAPDAAERGCDGSGPAPDGGAAAPRRVTVEPGGPVVVEGPVEVVAEDGTVAVSHRFAVAVCTCRRSARYPWCDTSHRAHERPRRGNTP
jgi:hypothetical protein